MDVLGHATLVASIVIEAAIAVIAVLIALQGRPYVYGLAFTFSVYVLYDLARFFHWDVEEGRVAAAVSRRHGQRPHRRLGAVQRTRLIVIWLPRSWPSPRQIWPSRKGWRPPTI